MSAPAHRDRQKAYGSSFRLKRFAIVKQMIDDIIARKGRCGIIDVGGEFNYWKPYLDQLERLPIEVLICNMNDRSEPFSDPRFTSRWANACDLSFAETGSFDLAHSNSVIEHVGRWKDMRKMADEMRRVANAYYLQTPNYWFPMEPHFRTIGYHWLPESWRAWLLTRMPLGYFPRIADFNQAMELVNDSVLIDKLQMRVLFPDAEHSSERLLGLAKSLIAIRRFTG
jgi:hypothetical protein